MGFKDIRFSSLRLGSELIELDRCKVMGIVNLTPDSFFGKSRAQSTQAALELVGRQLEEGADLVDLGAVSSRPGSSAVDEAEEWARLEPVLRELPKVFPEARISVDTFRAGIAERSADLGAVMINDISAGRFDDGLWDVVAQKKLAYVLMHMQGTPETMQNQPSYDDVVFEQIEWMSKRVAELRERGISDVLIDPGFGFGKRIEDNYRILANLEEYKVLGAPVMVGMSRKSMASRPLGIQTEEALPASTALHALAVASGARLLRVHEVKEAVQAIGVAHLWLEHRKPALYV